MSPLYFIISNASRYEFDDNPPAFLAVCTYKQLLKVCGCIYLSAKPLDSNYQQHEQLRLLFDILPIPGLKVLVGSNFR